MSTPNFAFFMPVEIYGWVCGSTSGLTRRLIGAFLPMPAAISFKREQFLLRLDVEHQYAGLERIFDFFFFLADAGENNLFGIGAHFQRAKQFAPRDDIETAAFLGEGAEQREIGIRFYRKTHDVAHLGESLIEDFEMALERRQAVNIRRRADFLRDALERHLLGEHLTVAVFKMIHLSPRATSTSLDGALNEPSNNCDETRYR